ncbi:MAG: cohesin domain-containing protein [Anaerolineae bacterium]|nr:cohesin domain-containing protein [Anaerolineae bacterium]
MWKIRQLTAICIFLSGLLLPLNVSMGNASFDPANDALAQPQAVTLTLAPSSPTVNVGDSRVLQVFINNVSDLGAFEFILSYNASVVTVTSVDLGPFLGSTGRSPFIAAKSFDNTTGKVVVGIASLGNAAGAVGSGVAISITFKGGAAVGTSQLTFSGVQITNVAGNTIASTAQNSSIAVQASAATSQPTATNPPNPTATPQPTATNPPNPTATSQPTATNPPNSTTTPSNPTPVATLELKSSLKVEGASGSTGLVGRTLLAEIEMGNLSAEAQKDLVVRVNLPDYVLVDSSSIEPAGGTVENVPNFNKANGWEQQAEAPVAKAVVWRLAQLPANGGKFVGKFKMVVTSAYDGKQPITLTTTVSGKTATSQQAVSASSSTSISACGYARCTYIPLLFWR